MTLLDALSAATDEITRELAPGSVELRLRGRDPSFVVTAPPAEVIEDVAQADPVMADSGALLAEEGPGSRINVRLPERLKAAVEEAAAKEGRSVNAWLVRAASAALQRSDRDQRLDPRPAANEPSNASPDGCASRCIPTTRLTCGDIPPTHEQRTAMPDYETPNRFP